MRAYICTLVGAEWCTLIHAESRGKAKYNFQQWGPLSPDDCYWVDIWVKRYPGLDDKPFTKETLAEAGFKFTDEDGNEDMGNENFVNDCRCVLCKDIK